MDQTGDAKAPGPAYRVLARKYRPSDFSTLIGQAPMVRTLTNAFSSGRIAQAWMLTGVRGVGKTTTARILARALNYKSDSIDQPTIELSTPGVHCEAIMEGRHVDVTEMDAASHTGVDNMRDLLEQVRYSPVSARYKVYIIDEVHMLSGGAFNAMLKTLEEPPPHVKFIFATTEIRKVPITILSRCQRFDLRRIEPAMITSELSRIAGLEEVEAEDEALAMVARASEGSMRDALSIFDQAIAHSSARVTAQAVRDMLGLADRARVIDLFETLMKGDVASALSELRAQYDAGADPATVLSDLAEFNHLVTRLRFVPEVANDASLSQEERVRGLDFAQTLPVRVLSRSWQMLLKGISEVQTAARPIDAAEMVLIRIAHAADLPTLDEALKALEGGAPADALPSPARSAPSTNGGTQAISTASLPSSGSPQGQTMRLVRSEEAREMAPAAPQAEPEDQPGVRIASLADIAALADQKRDLAFKVLVKRCVRPVKIEPGRLEIVPTDDAPRTLVGDLGKKLQEWTGRRWVISVSSEKGGPTLAETEETRRDTALVDARADPTVTAIMSSFPGARIIDVRLPDLVAESEETEPPVETDIDDDDGSL
ncbi:MAG: DNA polymerase III subunit gamma/tau [Mesorhizobium sp.]|nr:DNA polymerase III subunit gamma/tau [Mesorhizobium sp.]